jgi:formylglycine-generating enzyme required for sulfatase activity
LGKASSHPVQTVSWFDVVKWCNARSQKEGRTPAYYTDAALTQVYQTGQVSPYVKWNAGYRLPTEAEREKAARGGVSGHRFPWPDADTITHSRANYYSSSSYAYDISPTRGFHPNFQFGGYPDTSYVWFFAPNSYGLYDMAGNVHEWCWDWYGSYSSGSQTDPRGPASGSIRVSRGGSWTSQAPFGRTAYRALFGTAVSYDKLGFRSVLPPGLP